MISLMKWVVPIIMKATFSSKLKEGSYLVYFSIKIWIQFLKPSVTSLGDVRVLQCWIIWIFSWDLSISTPSVLVPPISTPITNYFFIYFNLILLF